MFPGTRNKEWEGMSFRVCQLLIRICLLLWILLIWPDHNGTDTLTRYRAVLGAVTVPSHQRHSVSGDIYLKFQAICKSLISYLFFPQF